ncbi:MAG: hypothetical protein RLZZ352_1881 [Pseudomonadota bacterium]|jgi:hypothetical protein
MPTPATLTRIDIYLEATQPVAWPHFAGSALRGAFGRALRQTACMTGLRRCDPCPLRPTCAYGEVFDPAPPAQPIHPSFRDGQPRYLVQAPPLGARQLSPGQPQQFSLLLLPGTEHHHSLIPHVLRTTVEQQLMQPGLFKLRHTHSHPTDPQHHSPYHGQGPISLRWLSPVRLQHQGKTLFRPQQLDATALAHSLHRRYLQWQQLCNQPATGPDLNTALQAAAQCQLDTRQLHWHDMERRSSTQQQKQPLGGLIGSAQLHGPRPALQTLWPLLQLGEQLHIGKETVMGLGRYQLQG